jgi:hypothetical protein
MPELRQRLHDRGNFSKWHRLGECGVTHEELDFKNTECLARDVNHGLFTEDDIPF